MSYPIPSDIASLLILTECKHNSAFTMNQCGDCLTEVIDEVIEKTIEHERFS